MVQITRIDVRYDGWRSWIYPKQFIAEIRKRLPLRRGGPFPTQEADGTYSEQSEAQLRNYEQRISNSMKNKATSTRECGLRQSIMGRSVDLLM